MVNCFGLFSFFFLFFFNFVEKDSIFECILHVEELIWILVGFFFFFPIVIKKIGGAI